MYIYLHLQNTFIEINFLFGIKNFIYKIDLELVGSLAIRLIQHIMFDSSVKKWGLEASSTTGQPVAQRMQNLIFFRVFFIHHAFHIFTYLSKNKQSTYCDMHTTFECPFKQNKHKFFVQNAHLKLCEYRCQSNYCSFLIIFPSIFFFNFFTYFQDSKIDANCDHPEQLQYTFPLRIIKSTTNQL